MSQRDKVREARQVAREALGDQTRLAQPINAAKYVPTPRSEVEPRKSRSIGVLTLGVAAARLGITRAEVERMIAAGKLRALETGWTWTVPVDEVERLRPR